MWEEFWISKQQTHTAISPLLIRDQESAQIIKLAEALEVALDESIVRVAKHEVAVAAATVAEATVLAAITKNSPTAKNALKTCFEKLPLTSAEVGEDVKALMHKTVCDEGLARHCEHVSLPIALAQLSLLAHKRNRFPEKSHHDEHLVSTLSGTLGKDKRQ